MHYLTTCLNSCKEIGKRTQSTQKVAPKKPLLSINTQMMPNLKTHWIVIL